MHAAVADLTVAVGQEHAWFASQQRAEYARTTLPQGTQPFGIVRPGDTRTVSDVARIASRYGLQTHPISCGKNWGYGDACAPEDGWLIVDLARMNRIHELNDELGYAVIEPGVTQGQLYQYLEDAKSSLLLDVTGAGPEASIVGNILQRGFGHTPYGDRFRHTCGFEVVLPDGSVRETGYGQFPNARAKRVFHWGLGPWWDGMLTQSHMGIVTSACLWLMPKPEVISGFAMTISDEAGLFEAIGAMRRLRMNGTVQSTVHIANDLRVISSRMDYPWDRCDGATPLPKHIRDAIRTEQGLGLWNVIGGLYGSRLEVRAAQAIVRKELRSIGHVHFFDERKLGLARRLASLIGWTALGRQFQEHLRNVENGFDLIRGVPNREHLNGAHWRAKSRASDLRDTGLIWVSPILPMTAEDVARLEEIAYPIFDRSKFDPLITLTSITERALCCVMSVNFDKTDAADSDRAAQCAAELKHALESAGYYPYRDSGIVASPGNANE